MNQTETTVKIITIRTQQINPFVKFLAELEFHWEDYSLF